VIQPLLRYQAWLEKQSWAALLSVSLVTPLPTASHAQAFTDPHPHFTAEDVFKLEYAKDPQVTPDGSQVAHARASMNIMTDKAEQSIWLINTDVTNHRLFVTGPRQ
jgi:hypothetical protein